MPGSTVLVVVTYDDLRLVMCEVLEHHGYQAVGAATADHALEILATLRGPCPIVLDDPHLPTHDAERLIAALEVGGHLSACPVVLVSGDPHRLAELGRGTHRNIVATLGKPFDVEEFLAIVRRADTDCASGRD